MTSWPMVEVALRRTRLNAPKVPSVIIITLTEQKSQGTSSSTASLAKESK